MLWENFWMKSCPVFFLSFELSVQNFARGEKHNIRNKFNFFLNANPAWWENLSGVWCGDGGTPIWMGGPLYKKASLLFLFLPCLLSIDKSVNNKHAWPLHIGLCVSQQSLNDLLCLFVFVPAHAYAHIHMRVKVRVCVYVHTHTHARTCAGTCMCVYIHVYVRMYVCVYMFTYIHI